MEKSCFFSHWHAWSLSRKLCVLEFSVTDESDERQVVTRTVCSVLATLFVSEEEEEENTFSHLLELDVSTLTAALASGGEEEESKKSFLVVVVACDSTIFPHGQARKCFVCVGFFLFAFFFFLRSFRRR